MAHPVSPFQAAHKNPWWQRPAQVLSWLLVVFITLTLLALLLPGVPYSSALGPFLLPHLFSLALAGLLLVGAVWYRRRTQCWLTLLVLAAGTVAGLVGIVTRQVGLAASECR